ncbi:hypothetical protein BSPA111_26870 [Buttiauxella sp. A111]|nr:hypothetical protein BSPA111_26870 [Buttiauxella sp. A111]
MWSLEALSYEYDIADNDGTVTRGIEGIIDADQLGGTLLYRVKVDLPPKWQ